ncbi:phosphopeptide-binding protein [Sporomusaceae bacterium FL31]|nr:phosphopeptide-binding protein [Sporomusaceae bacterium FL31]GCE35967.1 phosphopeptide-binding protein [Sporomusaceae bacterium]
MAIFDYNGNMAYNILYDSSEVCSMTFVRNLENIFEKYIEGFFNKKFSSGLQPVEIAKQLVKEMNSQRSVGISQVYVPNAYSVFLKKDDYERIAPYGSVIRDELSQYLIEEATRKSYTIIGEPIVDIFMEDELGKELFRISSSFTEPLPCEKINEVIECSSSDTRVFEKMCFASMPIMDKQHFGKVQIVEGLDKGMKFEVGSKRINIGRRESNELPLTDMNTSRLHAYIIYEEGNHVLHDAKSLNGTYVNGHRITRKILCSGDRIKVGNTIILYEVN